MNKVGIIIDAVQAYRESAKQDDTPEVIFCFQCFNYFNF